VRFVVKTFVADEKLAVDVHRERMRALLEVCEPPEECSPTLPTLREFLEKYTDAVSGLLHLDRVLGEPLRMDPAPLRELPARYLDYRVMPGYSSVWHDALERMAREPR
jgi:hypothetical protein